MTSLRLMRQTHRIIRFAEQGYLLSQRPLSMPRQRFLSLGLPSFRFHDPDEHHSKPGSHGEPTYPPNSIFLPPTSLRNTAYVTSINDYTKLHAESIDDSDHFWQNITKDLHFASVSSSKGLEYNFDAKKGPIFTKFMDGATTNLAYNCLERNIERGFGNRIAYLWEGNEPSDTTSVTYNELRDKVIECAKVLRGHGVKKGDVVAIYLPMILELPVAMLACARIGAVHNVVFAGFSAESLSTRIVDAKCKVVLTADGFYRGPKCIVLKPIVDKAVEISKKDHDVVVESVIIIEHFSRITASTSDPKPKVKLTTPIDSFYKEEVTKHKDIPDSIEWNQAEDPLFILYTSGSTGKPKGILHTTAGYMTYAYATTKYVFDLHPENANDIYWCTADCGWITGHTYLTYGPLLNGVTSIVFEGVPVYPDPSNLWRVVEKHKVTKFYTSPTAIRTLMAFGNQHLDKHDRSSLSIIGTVGEPLNPAAWRWLHEHVGYKNVSVVDTYWQTETGGHMILPLPGAVPMKPGAASFPFFGVDAVLLDSDGKVIEGAGEGNLCFTRAWPGMMRDVYGDHERFVKTYMAPFPGYYFTGDGARRDEDGYLWITGRVDDLMNVSGHLLSTAEIEGALTQHPKVAEAAVVAAPHDIKGSYPYAFVTLVNGEKFNKELVTELKQIVREKIGAIAQPDIIQEAPGLPKTRSGKVTRRILRKIAEGEDEALGDTTTLVDEQVIGQLIAGRDNRA